MTDKGPSDTANWATTHPGAYRSTPADGEQQLHFAGPTAEVMHAFARKLGDLNRTELLAGGTGDIQVTLDPRDILTHALALCAGMKSAGVVPPMGLVEALGAQVLALALAVRRVEELRVDTGDDAA